MLTPQPRHYPYSHLKVEIEKGLVKIPKFQREFVWTKEKTAQLIDSMLKGFPIGTFIFWKTKEELKHVRNIGNIELPETPEGDYTSYVLDGQQRITSLYAVREGAIINKEGHIHDYNDIMIDLSKESAVDEDLVITEKPKHDNFISVEQLLNGSMVDFIKKYGEETSKKIEKYKSTLESYNFSAIDINDYPLDLACEVFTRINTTGEELSLFEIMVAKTYDPKNGFDLAERYNWLLDNNGVEKDLEDANFNTLPASTVLQCVAGHLKKQVRRTDILKLDKQEFIDSWDTTTSGIFDAVDYITGYLRIPVSQLLPYNAVIVPLTYFFINNNGANPSNFQNKLLLKYFFWAALTNRFTSGVEGKLALDFDKMDKILKEEIPEFEGDKPDITLEKLKDREFSAGNAFNKAILCVLAHFQPKSFGTDGIVKLDNSWLKTSKGKNYHHFFPKAFLKKSGIEDKLANSVLNITIVDGHANKNEIRAKAPSRYMKKFSNENPSIESTMKSHLIDDIGKFGIWDDDYHVFLTMRGNRIVDEINKRLNPEM